MVILVVAGWWGKFFRVDVEEVMESEAGETFETTDETMERSTDDIVSTLLRLGTHYLLFVGSMSKPGSSPPCTSKSA